MGGGTVSCQLRGDKGESCRVGGLAARRGIEPLLPA